MGWLSGVIHPKIQCNNCVIAPKIHVIELKKKIQVDIRFYKILSPSQKNYSQIFRWIAEFTTFYPPPKKNLPLEKQYFHKFSQIYQSENVYLFERHLYVQP